MFVKTAAVLCIQLALFNAAFTQVLNRVVPISDLQNLLSSLGPNLIANNVVPVSPNIVPLGPNVISPNVVPISPCGPNVVSAGPNIVPVGPNVVPYGPNVVPVAPNVVETILSGPMTAPGPTTIIQDSSVANNLANALQLLVVSNLLSNTLPTMGETVVPSYATEVLSPVSLGGLGGYSIVY